MTGELIDFEPKIFCDIRLYTAIAVHHMKIIYSKLQLIHYLTREKVNLQWETTCFERLFLSGSEDGLSKQVLLYWIWDKDE